MIPAIMNETPASLFRHWYGILRGKMKMDECSWLFTKVLNVNNFHSQSYKKMDIFVLIKLDGKNKNMNSG